jgi:hypothetical protein
VEYWRDQDNIMLEEEHDKDYNELDEVRKWMTGGIDDNCENKLSCTSWKTGLSLL